ncbi:hypothetical protein C3B44_03810 [Corynebacterium yudongzhengii]|uniref:Uncharacterized protein n=1 Tax=Corynebacterium yudongzhengii TaxID=2080740 RepID=A0A2U1T6G1_9CORY|nr:hypothetical protein [Corynebacterium yudongzhengii]AWB81594.1 hypothetical protein C3B44_03810 [Corynebacterium yudongzhengii]PWC01579.1 hypothetical protein DF222_06470 [Corynebacterium yudongzhengii]
MVNPEEDLLIYFAPNKRSESPSPQPRRKAKPASTSQRQRRSLPDDPQHMIPLSKSKGFEVSRGGKHYKISHPAHPQVHTGMALTPSDIRWNLNFSSDIDHKFNIDLCYA